MRAIKRSGLQRIARSRLKEAQSLFNAGHWGGAYYLAGYVVECGLKACLAKRVQRHDFPDKRAVQDAYQHDLQRLVELTEHWQEIVMNKELRTNWNVVKDWTEQSRYDPHLTRGDAEGLLDAITNPKHGIMSWLEKRW